MARAILYMPSGDEFIGSADLRKYLNRLSRRLQLERREYRAAEELEIPQDVDSVAVLGGVSGLLLESGYMEMELEQVFRPQELLRRLRGRLPEDFAVVGIVDDTYSDYIMATYLKAGASAVVGTEGQLFGLVRSRIKDWKYITPYINVFQAVS